MNYIEKKNMLELRDSLHLIANSMRRNLRTVKEILDYLYSLAKEDD